MTSGKFQENTPYSMPGKYGNLAFIFPCRHKLHSRFFESDCNMLVKWEGPVDGIDLRVSVFFITSNYLFGTGNRDKDTNGRVN